MGMAMVVALVKKILLPNKIAIYANVSVRPVPHLMRQHREIIWESGLRKKRAQKKMQKARKKNAAEEKKKDGSSKYAQMVI